MILVTRHFFFVSIVVSLLGCTRTSGVERLVDVLGESNPSPTIIVMPPDVKVQLLTTGGMTVLRSDWTDDATAHLTESVRRFAETNNHRFEFADNKKPLSDQASAYVRLHELVGQSIVDGYFYSGRKLPTKAGAFDWTLGPEVAALKSEFNADYALFIHYRAQYSSGARKTLIVAAYLATLGYAPIGGGQQAGFASLVDLSDGKIVWFKNIASGASNLRKSSGADRLSENLMEQFPDA